MPSTPKQHGTHELRKAVPFVAGAQVVDTSDFELSYLDDFVFFWESPQLELDTALRPRIVTSFRQQLLAA